MPSDFTYYLPSSLRLQARRAIAARQRRNPSSDPQAGHAVGQSVSVEAAHRLADFDPPTAADFETLDVCDALNRLLDRVGAERLRQLLHFMECARGER